MSFFPLEPCIQYQDITYILRNVQNFTESIKPLWMLCGEYNWLGNFSHISEDSNNYGVEISFQENFSTPSMLPLNLLSKKVLYYSPKSWAIKVDDVKQTSIALDNHFKTSNFRTIFLDANRKILEGIEWDYNQLTKTMQFENSAEKPVVIIEVFPIFELIIINFVRKNEESQSKITILMVAQHL